MEIKNDRPQDLTTFKVVGKMRGTDFYGCIDSDYDGGVSPLTLWGLTDADFSNVTSEVLQGFTGFAGDLAEARKGAKTAIVFADSSDFGLGRMLENHLEIAGLPLEVHIWRNLDHAKKCLGIDERMIAASMVYKIGSCVQKTKTGKLDHRRSVSLIHELAADIQFNNDQNILVDLRNAEVQSDMQNLMMFAGECANNKSGFDNKIAILIPNTAERIETAKRFKSCMDMLGFQLRQFFGYQAAIEWLSVEE